MIFDPSKSPQRGDILYSLWNTYSFPPLLGRGWGRLLFFLFLPSLGGVGGGFSFSLSSPPWEGLGEANQRKNKYDIILRLPGISGELQFRDNVPWPNHWYSPGIMGPYSFVPFMECYHGIVSMDHSIHGQLDIEGERINFDQGRGYIE